MECVQTKLLDIRSTFRHQPPIYRGLTVLFYRTNRTTIYILDHNDKIVKPGRMSVYLPVLTQQQILRIYNSLLMSPSADARRVVHSFWRKYVHLVLVNRLLSLGLPRVVRLTDSPAWPLLFTVDIKQQNNLLICVCINTKCVQPPTLLFTYFYSLIFT